MTALFLATLLLRGETPGKTVLAFIDAFNAHDAGAMARQVDGPAGGAFPFSPDFPELQPTLHETSIDGDHATVVVDVVATGRSVRGVQKMHETVSLRRVAGDWRIVPVDPRAAPRGGDGVSPVGALAMLVTHPRLAMLAKRASIETQSFSQVKQISIATLMYASDHKDVLPTAKGFKTAIMPYLRNAGILTPPGAPKGTVGYFLDPRLSGLTMSSIARPAETAMILQGAGDKTVFPYAGKTPLGFVDGHAKLVDAAIVVKARKIGLK